MYLKDMLIQVIKQQHASLQGIFTVFGLFFMLTACSPDQETLIAEGKKALDNNDPQKAIDLFSRAIDQDSTSSESYNGRAVAYFSQEQFGLAIEDLNKSIAYDSSSYKPYYNRGNARQEIDNFEEAVADYSKAISLKPNIKDIYINRGVLLFKLANYEQALHDFEFAVKLDSGDVLAQFNRAKASLIMEKEEEARNALVKVLNMNPEFAEAYYWLGMIASENEHPEEACLLFQKALDTGFEQAKSALEENC